jgi:hypothetical protein
MFNHRELNDTTRAQLVLRLYNVTPLPIFAAGAGV